MPAKLDLTGYKLTFDDEFNAFSWNGGGNSGTWRTLYAYGDRELNDEKQLYTDQTLGIDPFAIVDGTLEITAAPSTDLSKTWGQPYSSGVINTYETFSQQYGVFEMRAKLPGGTGMWPAFWLLPNENVWPPELDVMEAHGHRPDELRWGAHTKTDLGNKGDWVQVDADTTDSYHTYTAKWDADTVTYYFDGVQVSQTPTPGDWHQPMYMIANLAIGGDWAGNPTPDTQFPAKMNIDYIRAYSNDANATAVTQQKVSAPDANLVEVAAAARSAAPRASAVATNESGTTGTSGNDRFSTNYGDRDTRTGGAGDDTYIITDPRGFQSEKAGEGVDTAELWVSYTLPSHLDNITIGGDWGMHATGNALSNRVTGNSGDDTLAGKAGDDLLIGGGGGDRFVVKAGEGFDTITDFGAGSGSGHDTVLLNGYSYKNGAEVLGAMSTSGADTVLNFRNGETLTFQNTSKGSFTADNFLFTSVTSASGDPTGPIEPPVEPPVEPPIDPPVEPPIDPPVNPPGDQTVGTGPDAIVLQISEDAWNGDAQFTIHVDGQQIGATLTATALHSSGQSQAFNVKGTFGSGPHTVDVTFLNDAWDGATNADRNLYVDSISYAGVTTKTAAALMSAGRQSFTVSGAVVIPPVEPETPGTISLGSGADVFVLKVSEDAWNGDAKFTVKVDGKQIGGTQTALALHDAGASQTFNVAGTFGTGAHVVEVAFLNDAWGGTASTDRNLYVDSLTYKGATLPGATLFSEGAHDFAVAATTQAPVDPAPSVMVLNMSEDAWKGDAQFTVSIDGVQDGGERTVTALHNAGASQAFEVAGPVGSGPHEVKISFVNDAWGGTPSTDRNLYVDSIVYGGHSYAGATLLDGERTFTVDGPSAAVASITTATLNSETVATGAGMSFIGDAAANTVTGGTGDDTLDGSASVDVLSGGEGHDTFVFRAGEGNGDTILDFVSGVDTLSLLGYGVGATLVQGSGTDMQVVSAGGALPETFHFTNGALIAAGDYKFG